MYQRHSTVIKFDLHIHSQASAYKEKKDIVANSNVANIPTLLSKLNDNKVSLFSITDHNRFDPQLYGTVMATLSQPNNPYPNVKALLPGVEFDVILDDCMEKCHIIVVFNAENCYEKMLQIENGLRTDLLTDEKAAYTKEQFEKILKAIGLDAILIASQRKDIHNHNGNHNSLSDSVSNVEEIIKIGYIDALEFQKPKVEGILINNLKDLALPMPLLSGSDCHDWDVYPYHDKHNQNVAFHHSRAKIMPTFKGLLMAVTSPDTRFNCRDNKNQLFFTGIQLGNTPIEIVNGINTIIGENGSGKTTILELINGKPNANYIRKLVEGNNIRVNNVIDPSKV